MYPSIVSLLHHVYLLLEANISVDHLMPSCITVISYQACACKWATRWGWCHGIQVGMSSCVYRLHPLHLHKGVRHPSWSLVTHKDDYFTSKVFSMHWNVTCNLAYNVILAIIIIWPNIIYFIPSCWDHITCIYHNGMINHGMQYEVCL